MAETVPMSRPLDKSPDGTHRKAVVAAGARLLAYCAKNNMTKAELAGLLNVHPSACSRWFTGMRSPYPDLRESIETLTGIPAASWRTDAEVKRARKQRRKPSP